MILLDDSKIIQFSSSSIIMQSIILSFLYLLPSNDLSDLAIIEQSFCITTNDQWFYIGSFCLLINPSCCSNLVDHLTNFSINTIQHAFIIRMINWFIDWFSDPSFGRSESIYYSFRTSLFGYSSQTTQSSF